MTQLTKKTVEVYELPPEFKPLFSEYRAVAFDGYCGEPIGWGFKPRSHLGEQMFGAAGKFGQWECLSMGNWVLVVKKLTPAEAVEKYGAVTELKTGPKGGFRTVTYGTTVFSSRDLNPKNLIPHPTPVKET